jgi:hypothetical protein
MRAAQIVGPVEGSGSKNCPKHKSFSLNVPYCHFGARLKVAFATMVPSFMHIE